jgi:hypothetical protein
MGDLFPDAPIPLAAQIAEVERELRLRAGAYPRFIAAGRMTQAAADRHVAAMAAALATLRRIEQGNPP